MQERTLRFLLRRHEVLRSDISDHAILRRGGHRLVAILANDFLAKLERLVVIPLGNLLRISDEGFFDELLLEVQLVLDKLVVQLRRAKARTLVVEAG